MVRVNYGNDIRKGGLETLNDQTPQTTAGKLLYQTIMDAITDQIRAGSFSYDKPICTESDLMEKYGVSRITVRRALSELESRGILYRKRGVGSFVCSDIYQKNALDESAQGGQASNNPLFAFVLPFNISRTGLTQTYQAASAYLNERGCMTSIFISEDTGDNRARYILSRLAQMNVAGVAYYPYTSNIHQEIVDRLMLDGKPVVLMDIPSPCKHLASVSSNNLQGSMDLMAHLIALGHKRIAFLSGITTEERATISDRYSGYLLGLSQAGIHPDQDLVYMRMTQEARTLPPEHPDSLSSVISRLRASGATAIICEHDGIAYEVMQRCLDMGIQVQEDMSICGFDRSEWATVHMTRVITSVAHDYAGIGRAVGEELYQGLSDPLRAHEPRIIPMQLSAGNTTGPART